MARAKIGVQLQPQATTTDDLRAAWKAADEMGADSIWVWDHFFPLFGDPDETHFEGWTLLAAMAVETERAMIGALVGCNSYRNPELLADMARTIDHLSAGRFYLGIGAGWFERDYTEYGYDFGTPGSRLRDLDASLDRMKDRLAKLNPAPVGRLPIMVGGGGEKVTLRITAEKADSWNTFGPPENFAHKNSVLTDWCSTIGRDPAEVERTVAIGLDDVNAEMVEAYLAAGAEHIIYMCPTPFDLSPVQTLLELVR